MESSFFVPIVKNFNGFHNHPLLVENFTVFVCSNQIIDNKMPALVEQELYKISLMSHVSSRGGITDEEQTEIFLKCRRAVEQVNQAIHDRTVLWNVGYCVVDTGALLKLIGQV